MLMDRGRQDLSRAVLDRLRLKDIYSDPNVNQLKFQAPRSNYVGFPYVPACPPAPNPEDVLSDASLNYISRMLLEEDIDEKVSNYQEESAALRAAEKPFYDILGQAYPLSPDQPPLYSISGLESPEDSSGNKLWGFDPHEYQQPLNHPFSADYSSQSSFSSSNSVGNFVDPIEEPLVFGDSQSAWQFRKGVEEAWKFLPSNDKLVLDVEANGFPLPHDGNGFVGDYPGNGSRGRKNPCPNDFNLEEGRSSKQTAISAEDILRSEMFDSVLLCYEGKRADMVELRQTMQKETSKSSQVGNPKGSNGGKARGKKQPKKEVVDLRTLLIHCAQAVAADDRRSSSELLRQIRQHSTPYGDGTQRLAHCFADGLEARLAGTGSQIYHSLVAKRTTATDTLKAYHLYLAACPFKRISHFVANRIISALAVKATRIHIVDFGIYFGFQWPCFIQNLASRPGGPPRLRITGIDVPQPGFRPTERIEETGRRLADYAKIFEVPFEYNPISSKWENIRVEDLKIEEDELLVVNCMYRFRNLVDETVVADSPRNKVLNTIRRMNPDLFVHGVVNGSYNAPFFVTRFREALFHFSALFDMLDTNVPREDEQRLLIERDLFGRDALNVVACEGSERVERPETYKQWQVRNLRAGFEQIPLNPGIMKQARDNVRGGSYHKDFVIDEDSRWLLQGWKGRIIYALSTWKPSTAR